MDIQSFAHLRPTLFHLTTPASWEKIKRHGLFCAQSLLRQAGIITEQAREEVFLQRREGPYSLTVPLLNAVTLRDQMPLHPGGLKLALNGCMTTLQWVDLLNERVFLWTRRQDATSLMKAAATSKEPKCLVQLDTLRLLRAYKSKVEVTTFNVGYAMRKAKQRDRNSFQKLELFSPTKLSQVRELTICSDIPDAASYVIGVETLNTA